MQTYKDYYYRDFPKAPYLNKPITDITRRFRVVSDIKLKSPAFFQKFTIQIHEPPDMLSFRLYGTKAHWRFILDINEIVDPFFDWYLSLDEFNKYLNIKYGDSVYEVHHHETSSGLVVDPDYTAETVFAITNYEYEERMNDAKRNIEIIKPRYISAAAAEYTKKIKEIFPREVF